MSAAPHPPTTHRRVCCAALHSGLARAQPPRLSSVVVVVQPAERDVELGCNLRPPPQASPCFSPSPPPSPPAVRRLEAVHDDVVLLHELRLHEELLDVASLVALNLDDLTQLVVVDDGAVAVELLLELLENLLLVVRGIHALHRRQGLPTIPLLDAYVYLGHGSGRAVVEGPAGRYVEPKGRHALEARACSSLLPERA